MDFTQESLLEVIQQFVIEKKGETPEPLGVDSDLLRGGMLDSLALVSLAEEISKTFERTIPRGSLIPEDFETPGVLWGRLSEIWSES